MLIKRYDAIDILRAIAIIGMIQVHFVEILSSYYNSTTLLSQLSNIFGSLPAPLFTFLVGMSLFISVKKQELSGIELQAIADRNLRRGVAIFFLGLVHAALIWTPAEVFGWDILTLIGATFLIVFPLRKLSNSSLSAIIVVILAMSPLLRYWSDYHSSWNHWGEYVPAADLKGALLGFTLNGYFPLLPWLLFPLCGYLVGKACFGGDKPRLPHFILPVGAALVILALGLMITNSVLNITTEPATWYLSPFTFYPASTAFLLITLGINLLLFWFFYRRFDLDQLEPKTGKFLNFCRRYSRYALTAYVVHHAVLVWPLLAAASFTGKGDQWFFYGEVLPTHYSLLLALLFIALFYVAVIYWDKRGGRYSFEWLLKRLTG